MKKVIIPTLFLISIVLAIITRFYLLGEAPHGLYLDEAGQGYSAYSLLKTGKDEFGKPFPIVFRSFLDFKTPVYIYLIVPLINFFGLTKFTVRLPSAVFSIFTFPYLYLIIENLSNKKYTISLAVVTSFLLAISPWHILFGRTNFEVNVSLFFLISGLYFFYKALGFSDWRTKSHHKPWYLVVTAVLFAIAIPAYHAQRVVTPAIMITLALRYRSILLTKAFRKPIIIGALLGLLISIPTISVMSTPGFLKRASGLNIFTNETAKPAGYLENYNGFAEPFVNSQLFLSTKEFAGLYLSYFSPRNMFVLGDSGPRSSFPYLGTFFLWQFPFYIYGLYLFCKRKELGEIRFLTLALLFISPLPAAVTRDPYSTIRSLNMVIPQIIITSYGIVVLYHKALSVIPTKAGIHIRNTRFRIKSGMTKIKKLLNLSLIFASLFIILYSILKLWSSVIILNEYYRGEHWNYGWQEVAETIVTLDPSLPIVVDNARSEPYSQLLFFLKFDPVKYQEDNFEVPLDEYYTNLNRNKDKVIGNIITRPINWEQDLRKEQYLIGDALSISDKQIEEHNLKLIRDITYPDWSIAFRIVKTTRNDF